MFYTCSGHILKLQITFATRELTSGSKRETQGEPCSRGWSLTLASEDSEIHLERGFCQFTINHSFSYIYSTS